MQSPVLRTDPSAFHPQLVDVDDILHVRPRAGSPFEEAGAPLVEVAQIWSGRVLSVRHLQEGALHVGSAEDVDFLVCTDDLPQDRWPLVTRTSSGVRLDPGGGTAWRYSGGDRIESSGGALRAGDRWVVELGGTLFLVRTVAAPAALPPAPLQVDWLFSGLLVALIFVAAALAITLAMRPYDPSLDTIEVPEHFVKLMLQEPEKKKKAPARQLDAGAGERAKEEAGKTGDKTSKLPRAKGPRIAQNHAELNRLTANAAGLLAEISAMKDNAIFGSDGLGQEVTSALGGLIGTTYGRQAGEGGFAGRGVGPGGGGPAQGIGGVGTHGSEFGREGGGKLPGIEGPTKPGGGPGVSARDPIILGALDKSLIDEVIKKKLPAIRYCYQKQLNQQPSLAGKVVMKFTIDKQGGVSSASVKSSTLRNPVVEACVRAQFLQMRFPPPRGGGIVIVSYPFVFNSAG